MTGEQYYGAKASINVWAPKVTSQYEFSLSQMWVISGSFSDDLNTIEAGWQACFFFHINQTRMNHILHFVEILGIDLSLSDETD